MFSFIFLISQYINLIILNSPEVQLQKSYGYFDDGSAALIRPGITTMLLLRLRLPCHHRGPGSVGVTEGTGESAVDAPSRAPFLRSIATPPGRTSPYVLTESRSRPAIANAISSLMHRHQRRIAASSHEAIVRPRDGLVPPRVRVSDRAGVTTWADAFAAASALTKSRITVIRDCDIVDV